MHTLISAVIIYVLNCTNLFLQMHMHVTVATMMTWLTVMEYMYHK
jgi:hypothetical protein